ncbi:hypothetical protein Tco_0520535 [Tanacetum coccineum]
MPPTPDLYFTTLDEFVNKLVVEDRKSDEEVSKVVRKNDDALIIEELVLDSKEENVSQTKTEKKTVKSSIAKIEFVKPKQQEKTARKTNLVPRAVLMKSRLVSINTARQNTSKIAVSVNTARQPQMDSQDQGVIDSGCSRHMSWNMSYLSDYEETDG